MFHDNQSSLSLSIAITLLISSLVCGTDLYAAQVQEVEPETLAAEVEAQEQSAEEEKTADKVATSEGKESAEEVPKVDVEDGPQPAAEAIAPDVEDAEASGVDLPPHTKRILSEEQVEWIWKLVFVFLGISFLLWLLSLMTNESDEAPVSNSADSMASDIGNVAATATEQSDFGKLFTECPSDVDDLTKIGGIDAAAQKRLNEAGIWQYDQLRSMTAQQRANLQRKLNLPRIRWYSLAGIEGASTASSVTQPNSASNGSSQHATSNRTNAGEGVVRFDSASSAANASVAAPKFRDDLTRLPGVDSELAAEMNKQGIHSFKQLQSFSPIQQLAFEKRFGVAWDKLELSKVIAAGATSVAAGQGSATANASSGSSSGSATSGNSTTVSGGSNSGGAAQLKGTGSSSDTTLVDGSPASGSSAGHHSSSPAREGSPSNGQGSVTVVAAAGAAAIAGAAALADKGSDSKTNSSDSTSSDPGSSATTVTGFAAGNLPAESSEVTGGSAGSSESASSTTGSDSVASLVADGKGRVDDSLGFLYTTAPVDADDLTKLAGINSAEATRLNEAGIYKFEQLAGLDEKQVAELSSRFRIPDADFADWRRCFYAWGRGIHTTADEDELSVTGILNGIELPQIVAGVFDGARLVAYPEQVIFRGSNPEGWGTGNDGIDGVETSISCDAIRSDINYLRIRRTDTRESVVVPMTKGQIFSNGDMSQNGWNGSSEVFFGGRHVGVFAQHLPQEIETKFSQGGWGFGHRYDHNDRQEWGWAGRVVEPTTFEISVGCIGKTPGTVVFRGSDPSIWNTRTRDDERRFADPVSSVAHPVNFVRIMREATGEAVIVRVDGNHVLDEGFDPRCGWNGSCSEFSGGRHLGVYHSDLPQDFETRFEFGGWGFGHPFDDNDRQAWGWAGRQLPETVFEISLLETVPDFMKHEVLDQA